MINITVIKTIEFIRNFTNKFMEVIVFSPCYISEPCITAPKARQELLVFFRYFHIIKY